MFCGEGVEEVRYTNVYETFGPETLSEEVSDALNHSVTGTLGPACEAGLPGDTSAPFEFGAQELKVGDPGDDVGCGCTSSPRAPAGLLLVGLVLGLLRRRLLPKSHNP